MARVGLIGDGLGRVLREGPDDAQPPLRAGVLHGAERSNSYTSAWSTPAYHRARGMDPMVPCPRAACRGWLERRSKSGLAAIGPSRADPSNWSVRNVREADSPRTGSNRRAAPEVVGLWTITRPATFYLRVTDVAGQDSLESVTGDISVLEDRDSSLSRLEVRTRCSSLATAHGNYADW